ncbi:DNA topoisomerase IB [Yangia mangrovi]|uniref:DNA topoisomerase n=1 Tax=Alloyangia mangrovi TaxID=1779329 RepID=A0A2A3JWT5_9RHOB|nr:DNA topoisomerase IB [Alloyangia mangrovi]MCA0939040.1 DNA topoisomerase IB [Alloyangia pacifica]MCA0944757.1 DNA topoisomerase IB [Alloyangia pacifica]MCT4373490.1 DNA topoisomerase IB [Alloyangia mangrovi]
MTPRPDLIYYPDSQPGILRRRCGRGFSYIAPDGTRIDAAEERARIRALAVPPAYEQVWICPRANGHLQATGRDARDRKQYRYHPDWTAFRSERKYGHLAEFGAALPGLRRSILTQLRARDPGDREFALAATLALLDRAGLRVGNADYALENGSYGATTLRGTHLRLDGGTLHLRFPGKGGKRIHKQLKDRTLQRALTTLGDLPGKELIAWLDEDGQPHGLRSDEVNRWLAERTGNPALTAKTFRTWNGSVAALEAARTAEKVSIKAMAEAAAERLANTPTVARSSYIHPAVIALAETGLPKLLERAPDRPGLRRAEAQLLALLER